MTRMSQSEKERFLSDLHIGVLAINEEKSGPLTTPLWYDYSPGGEVLFIVAAASKKGNLLKVGSRISLVAQRETLPYSYVSVEGPVVDIEATSYEQLLAMAQRYLGDTQGKRYTDASDIDAQISVRMSPERWLAVDYGKTA